MRSLVKEKIITAGENKTVIPYQTRWKHIDISEFVLIEPQVTMETLIEKLENTFNKYCPENEKIHYTRRQIQALKQLYNNVKGPDGKPRTKSIQGWTVEYLKDGNYVRRIKPIKISKTKDKTVLKNLNGKIWIHELHPIIKKVNSNGASCPEIAEKLNEAIKNPDANQLFNIIKKDYKPVVLMKQVENMEALESVFEISKKHQDLKHKIDKLKETNSTGIMNILNNNTKTTSGWSLKKE